MERQSGHLLFVELSLGKPSSGCSRVGNLNIREATIVVWIAEGSQMEETKMKGLLKEPLIQIACEHQIVA